jgi:hypothetical protein
VQCRKPSGESTLQAGVNSELAKRIDFCVFQPWGAVARARHWHHLEILESQSSESQESAAEGEPVAQIQTCC